MAPFQDFVAAVFVGKQNSSSHKVHLSFGLHKCFAWLSPVKGCGHTKYLLSSGAGDYLVSKTGSLRCWLWPGPAYHPWGYRQCCSLPGG